MIDDKYNDQFFNHTLTKGYCTRGSNQITSLYWNAMVEAASLRVTQQWIMNKFLTLNFGKRIVESEKKLDSLNKYYIPYQKHQFDYSDGRRISIFHRSLATLFEFHKKRFVPKKLAHIKHIEVSLGGDHGKGSHTFLAIVKLHYTIDKDDY